MTGETITIYREKLPYHPKLGRNILFDSRSLCYPVSTAELHLVTTFWRRHIDALDQGQLGSCTGNAGVGNLATEPFFLTAKPGDRYSLTEDGAVLLYSDNTRRDPFPGQYPPDDTGSDGTSTANCLVDSGQIRGFTHAGDGPTARLALTRSPGIVGIKWYESMFTTDPDGRVRVDRSSGLAGGHELSFDGIDVEAGRVWFTNSWGGGWGVARDGIGGRAWFTFDDFDALMADQGDAQFFTPLSAPAPTPTPPAPVPTPGPAATDEELWAAGKAFVTQRHVVPSYIHLAHTLGAWGVGKGFTS